MNSTVGTKKNNGRPNSRPKTNCVSPQAQPIEKYAQLVFSRPAFREGLSEREQEMRL